MSAAIRKTTMSVPEMREMLGLKKTESYWLVHKNYFDTVMVNGKMRIVIKSFEDWYANQVRYKKVDGPEPGKKLRERSFSIAELAALLGIDTDSVYELLQRAPIKTHIVNHQKRVDRKSFENWYKKQEHYRTQEDREQDREAEETSMSLPEMGAMIGLDRNQTYALVNDTPELQVIRIGGRRRVVKTSFEEWYANQDTYRKFEELAPQEQVEMINHCDDASLKKKLRRISERADLKEKINSQDYYSVEDVARMMNASYSTVIRMIQAGTIEGKRFDKIWKINKNEILWLLSQEQSYNLQNGGVKTDGSDCVPEQ